jgi:hypothetical protein
MFNRWPATHNYHLVSGRVGLVARSIAYTVYDQIAGTQTCFKQYPHPRSPIALYKVRTRIVQ